MDKTIIIDTGAAIEQRVYAMPEGTSKIVSAVKMLSHITDTEDIMFESCMSAWRLFDTCRTAAITQFRSDGYAMVKLIRDGIELAIEDLAPEVEKNTLTDLDRCFIAVPSNSITYRIADALKPVVWLQGEQNPHSFWFRQPVLCGVPWFHDDHVFAGALVVSLRQRGVPTDHQVFVLQLIAEALSASYAFCQRYRRSIQMEQALMRESVARSLHDSVVQTIFSMQLKTRDMLTYANIPDVVREDLSMLKAMADKANADMRHILMTNSDSHATRNHPCIERLEHVIELHNTAGGVPVTLMHEGIEGIPEPLSEAFCAFAREGLRNVRKHAHATQVLITLARQGEFAYISIIDDGIGLHESPATAHKGFHFGTKSLERIVKALDGYFGLEDIDGEGGVMLYARIPFST